MDNQVTHNGIDSRKLFAKDAIVGCPQKAITSITGTAGAIYGTTEENLINDHTIAINDIITKLKTIGITL